MRGLLVAVVAMGVLIVVGTATLGVLIFRKMGEAAAPVAAGAVLDEPAGTRIAGMTALPDRLALLLSGGGPDRVLLVDARTGRALGRVQLAH